MEEKICAPKIGEGFRVGRLTVAEKTDARKGGYVVWRCVCDCGGEILLDTRCLQRGTVRDCGCLTRVKPGQKDLTGQRFGMLTAVEPVGDSVWRCVCDCGGEIEVPRKQLTGGFRKSCGCLSRPEVKSLVGQRFGMLVVNAYAGKVDGMHRWQCVCDCGRETVVGQTLLMSGKTCSCGCLRGEKLRETLKLCEGTSILKLESAPVRRIRSNTSGYNGVYFSQKRGKWVAQITFRGKTYYLGSFDDRADAAEARRSGEKMYADFIQWYYKFIRMNAKKCSPCPAE